MTTAFAIRTLIEIAAVLFVIFGVLHEQKFIDFEDKIIRFVAKRIYLRKRKKAIAKNVPLSRLAVSVNVSLRSRDMRKSIAMLLE